LLFPEYCQHLLLVHIQAQEQGYFVRVQVVDAVLSSDGMGSALRCDRMAVTR
jgi:hypothetical protein